MLRRAPKREQIIRRCRTLPEEAAVTTRADPMTTDDRLLARAADEALARAQELSMMLTGEPLAPRLELGMSTLAAGDGRVPLGQPETPVARGMFAGMWGNRARAGDDAAEPRYPFKGLIVPLLVFAGMLTTVAVTSGDGTRGVLALGAVAVGVLIVLIPVLLRRPRPSVNPVEAKGVLDLMAGVVLALRPAGADDRAETVEGAGAAGNR
jgi:hypothetical protein